MQNANVIELIQFAEEKKKIVAWKMKICIHSQLQIDRFVECGILNVKNVKC